MEKRSFVPFAAINTGMLEPKILDFAAMSGIPGRLDLAAVPPSIAVAPVPLGWKQPTRAASIRSSLVTTRQCRSNWRLCLLRNYSCNLSWDLGVLRLRSIRATLARYERVIALHGRVTHADGSPDTRA